MDKSEQKLIFDQAFKSFKENKKEILKVYKQIISYPTISAEPSQEAFLKCSQWLISLLKDWGLHVDTAGDSNRPIVIASSNTKTQDALLFYCHYDVQPTDPDDQWQTDPFELSQKGDLFYGRGAQDNKGQLIYTLMAVKSALRSTDKPIKIILDPEEEIGSPTLSKEFHTLKDKLQCSALIVVDGLIPAPDKGAITVGCRGIVTMDVKLRYHNEDLHSGLFGGFAANPSFDLAQVLGSIYSPEGKIQVPGFDNDINTQAMNEQQNMQPPLSLEDIESTPQTARAQSEDNNHSLLWAAPTVEINGFHSGFDGEGFKTIIPASASAKISCRLVPGQNPIDIANKVKSFILDKLPYPEKCQITIHPGFGGAFYTDPNSKLIKQLQSSFAHLFEKGCDINCIGGSIPIVSLMQETLNIPTAIVGMGLASDLIHAPNEHFSLTRLKTGYAFIYSIIHSI